MFDLPEMLAGNSFRGYSIVPLDLTQFSQYQTKLLNLTHMSLNTSFIITPIKQTSRNSILDSVRLFAAFGVVFIHVHTESWPAEMSTRFFLVLCVPFFFTTSLFYFTISLRKNISVINILRRIWQKIFIPFLTWSIIYIVLSVIKAVITDGEKGLRSINVIVVFLYGGSSEQMYYLPELIIMQIIILSVFLLITEKNRVTGLFLFISSTFYLSWGYSHKYFGVTSISHVLMYITMALYLTSEVNPLIKSGPKLAVGCILIGLSFSKIWAINSSEIGDVIPSLPIGGLGLFLVASNIPDIRIPDWLRILSSTAFGIYLSHIVFLEALEFFLEKSHFHIYYGLFTKTMIAFLIFSISTLFTLFMMKIPKLKTLLLGESD